MRRHSARGRSTPRGGCGATCYTQAVAASAEQQKFLAQAEAQLVSAAAQEVEARQEQERQQSLSQTESGTRQKLEQATAAFAKAQADVQHELVDRFRLMTFPLVLGSGRRLFNDGILPATMRPAGLAVTDLGIVIGTYEPAGPVRHGQM